jgi:hypothetical protein
MLNLPPAVRGILTVAAHTPSGHNTQPWKVKVLAADDLLIRSDPQRWLRAVDPANRELLLSFGAFAETLSQAAAAQGWHADLAAVATTPTDTDIWRVTLTPATERSTTSDAIITHRATTRTPFATRTLEAQHIQALLGVAPTVSYAPRESAEGRWLVDGLESAFRQQTLDDRKQAELSNWLRFSRSAVKRRGDGLTGEALGLSFPLRLALSTVYKPSMALSATFRNSSINNTRAQAQGCAGFVFIRSRDESIAALLETGRVYERVCLKMTELGVAHHTMSQALEEAPWAQEIQGALQSADPIQFVIRVGYARRLARPAIRRSIDDFIE